MLKKISLILVILLTLNLCACTDSTKTETLDPETGESAEASVTTEAEKQESQTKEPQTQESQTEDPRFSEVERDAQGNIIRTLEGERGKDSVERFYDTEGILLREIAEMPDGQRDEREFYPDGKLCSERIEMPDGIVIDVCYTESGYRLAEEVRFPEGDLERTTFDERGCKVRKYAVDSQGNEIETVYDEKEIPLHEIVRCTDGTTVNREFHENGSCKAEQQRTPDGVTIEREYDSEGNLIRDVQISPDGEIHDNLAPESGGNGSDGNDDGNGAGLPEGTLVGSVTKEGEYTVVVLGQDNWRDYLEEYMDVLFLPDQDRLIIRKYFLVKSSVGQVDEARSHVELQYIYEQRDVSCTVDMSKQIFTPGSIINVGNRELAFIDLEQFRVLSRQYVDGKPIGYGLSCSACELNGASTVFPDPTVVDLAWVTGTLYLK